MMNCICFGAIFQWYHKLGLRILKLEQKVEYLERHVVIDIEALKN
jgi:hypothetical protein